MQVGLEVAEEQADMQPGAAELVDKQQVVLEQVVGIAVVEMVAEVVLRLSAQGVVVAS